MNASDNRYQLPENTDRDVRKMYIWLGVLFGGLILVGLFVIIFAQQLAKYIPFSAEENFIRPYERLLLTTQKKDESENVKIIQSYLEDLVIKLESSDSLSKKVTFKIHYSDQNIENAFATLGGHMVIYRGLMNSVKSENGLAMIIAHEMAHIENRDPAAGMGRALAIHMIIASISGGYSEGAADLLSDIGFNQFSKKQERKADLLALKLLHELYGHVGGNDEFFQEMMDEDINIPEWLTSHPDLKKRIEYLQKESADKNYLAGETVNFPEKVREALDKYPF